MERSEIHLGAERWSRRTTSRRTYEAAGEGGLARRTGLFLSLRYEKALAASLREGDDRAAAPGVIKDDPSFCQPTSPSRAASRAKLDEATEILLQGFRATRNPVFLIKLEDLCVETERPQAMIGSTPAAAEFPSDFDVNLFMGSFSCAPR